MKKINLVFIIILCCLFMFGCNDNILIVHNDSMKPIIKINDTITYKKTDSNKLKEKDIIVYNHITVTYLFTEEDGTKTPVNKWTDDGITIIIIDDNNYLDYNLERKEESITLITRIRSIRKENNEKIFTIQTDLANFQNPYLGKEEITKDVIIGKVVKVNNKSIE